jgi:hypothetical protein
MAARAAWRLVDIAVAPEGATFSFTLDRAKQRQVRRREGRYLLRTNLTGKDPAELWRFYYEPRLVDLPHPALGQELTPSPTARRFYGRAKAPTRRRCGRARCRAAQRSRHNAGAWPKVAGVEFSVSCAPCAVACPSPSTMAPSTWS